MRRAAPFLAAGLLLSGLLCLGQQPRAYWKSVPQVNVGASYSGPGDVVSGAKAFWGTRAYNAAFSGAILNLCDAATGLVCADATWTAAGGISLPLLGGVACNNTTAVCNVAKAYDTTAGNNCGAATCDISQTTNANRPQLIIPAASNGCPTDGDYCIAFVRASNECLSSANSLSSFSTPNGVSLVATRTGNTNQAQAVISVSGVGTLTGWANVAGRVQHRNGTLTTIDSITDSTWYAMQGVYSNTAGAIYINGSTTSQNNGTNSMTGTIIVGANSTASTCSGFLMDGKVREIGLWNSDLTANFAALNANDHAYPSAW